MSAPHRIKLHIDALRTHGMTRGEANALAESLRQNLQAQLRADPAALQSMAKMQVTVPQGAPAQKGAAIATQITKQGGQG